MGLDDFFEDNHKKNGGYRNQGYNEHQSHYDNQYKPNNRFEQHSNHRNDNYFNLVSILEKLRGNRKLKSLVMGIGLLLVAIVIILLIFLLPLIIKLINWISQNGLQGLIDNATNIIDKLLNGSK